MTTATVFKGQRTKVVRCSPGSAIINPEYRLQNLSKVKVDGLGGLLANDFALWYERHRDFPVGQNKRWNPWLVRGLRVAVVEPGPGVA
jgi:hypothetical protein